MNMKRALTGGIGVLLGSFALGAVVQVVKSVRETIKLHEKTKQLEAESDRLEKQVKQDIADCDDMVRDMDRRIDEIKAEFERRKNGPDPMKEEIKTLIKRANKFMEENDEINEDTRKKQTVIEELLDEFDD